MSEKDSKNTELKNIIERFRVTQTTKNQIKELAKEKNITESEVLENAFKLYYSQDILPENIILGRMTQLQHLLTLIDRKLETLSGVFYTILPYIFGTLPSLPKNETDANGQKYNPGLVKGKDVLEKLIKTYKKDWRTYKISFVQSVWADMQEDLTLTKENSGTESNDTDRSN